MDSLRSRPIRYVMTRQFAPLRWLTGSVLKDWDWGWLTSFLWNWASASSVAGFVFENGRMFILCLCLFLLICFQRQDQSRSTEVTKESRPFSASGAVGQQEKDLAVKLPGNWRWERAVQAGKNQTSVSRCLPRRKQHPDCQVNIDQRAQAE